MLRGAVALCALAALASAAYFNSPLEQKPDKFKDVEGCYIGALDKVVPKGETEASATECTLYRCDDKWYDYYTCVVVAGEPPCKTVTDSDKLYPDCCPRVECPETGAEETTEK